MLEQFRAVERAAAAEGVTFAEAMRLLAGADVGGPSDAARRADPDWSRVAAGPWLAETLRGLRRPEALARVDPGDDLRAHAPAVPAGRRALAPPALTSLGLGACLADDMGLGKTIQVLSLLLVRQAQAAGCAAPSLLVAPASLLANWAAEIERFAPGLRGLVAHPSAMPADDLENVDAERLGDGGSRDHELRLAAPHRLAGEDDLGPCDPRRGSGHQEPGGEADARRQALEARARIALTGTPDREPARRPLVDLRLRRRPASSGSAKEFIAFAKRLARAAAEPLRATAGSGAPVHLAAPQDRQVGHRRPAGQDRDEGVLHAEPQAGSAVRDGRPGARARRSARSRESAARGWSSRS